MPQVLQALFALAFAVFVTGSSPAQSIAVQQFGAFPNDGIDDTPAINRALARAPAGTVLQFLPGQYDMRAQDPLHHLCLTRLSGLHLRGATTGGRTSLVFHDRVQSGIVLDESTDCTVEHFDLGYAEKTFTQGVILAIDPSEMYIDVQIAPGYRGPHVTDDALLGSTVESVIVYDPLSRVIKPGSEQLNLRATNPVTVASSGVFRLHFPTVVPLGPTGFNLQVGDLFALKSGLGTVLRTRACVRTVLRDLTITSSGSAGIGGSEDSDTIIENVRMIPANDGLLSVVRCGIHIKDSRSGPIIRDCRLERTGDDAIAIAGTWFEVLTVIDPSTVVLGLRNPLTLEPRAQIRFQDGNTYAVLDDNQIHRSTYLGFDPVIQRYRFLIRLRNSTAAQPGDLAVRTDMLAKGFRIERNVIRNHRARGILSKGSHGLIADNDLDGSNVAGIVLGPELDFFLEASFVEDVVISGNRLRNIGFGRAPHVAQAAAIVVTLRTFPAIGGGLDVVSRQNKRIVIRDNLVSQSGHCGLMLVGAENVSVLRNEFFAGQSQPLANGIGLNYGLTATPLTSIHIQNCGWVQLADNRIEPSIVGDVFVSASSTNFVSQGNQLVSYTGFETYETANPWPASMTNGGQLFGHNPLWTQVHDGQLFTMRQWGVYGNPSYPHFIDQQATRSEHGGGSLEIDLHQPQAIEFSLGSNFLTGNWMLAVDIQALGFPNSAVLLATYSNTSSDLDASGPVPYWARKRIQLNCPPGIFRLRFRRLDMTHGSPYLYLDEFAVEH